jgi:alkanesulfonate monooxygenase SsuD/methylene tetrahydromethanopterin reductase-like flavin-dependent oxidoreductase (luciferase family)
MTLTYDQAPAGRAFLGTELVDAAGRFPCRIEDEDESDPGRLDLGNIVRLARTAERGGLDYLIVDDTLAGNPPFSGRRRDAFEAMRLAVRLASSAQGVRIAPRVHYAWIEPAGLLEALVGLELASAGPMAWQLDMHDHAHSLGRGPELWAAIVTDVWGGERPKTGLGALARAHRNRRVREGLATRRTSGLTDDAAPLLLVRACGEPSERLGARHADLVRIDAPDAPSARERRRRIRERAAGAGRDPDGVRVVVDVAICLNSVEEHAWARAELIESITSGPLGGAGARYVGTPEGLVEWMAYWLEEACCDGFTLLPASLPIDLVLAVDLVVPELRRRGLVPVPA